MKSISVYIGSTPVEIGSDFVEIIAAAGVSLSVSGVNNSQCASDDGSSSIRISIYAGSAPALPPGLSGDPQSYNFEIGLRYDYYAANEFYRVVGPLGMVGFIHLCERKVEWWLSTLPSFRAALHMLILDPVSLLTAQDNVLVCHAGALRIGSDIALLLGPSKSGKSSISYLTSHDSPADEIHWVSDDTVVLDFSGSVPHAYPIRSGYGLPKALVDSIQMRFEPASVLIRTADKIYFRHLPFQDSTGGDLKKLIYLSKDPSAPPITSIEVLTPEIAIRKFLESQTTIPNPGMLSRLTIAGTLSSECKSYKATYRDSCEIEAIREVLFT